MRKLLVVLLFINISFFVFSAEIELLSSRYLTEITRISSQEYKIIYDTKENVLILWEPIEKKYISKNNIPQFRNVLKKFLEWRTIAIENKVEINRDIPDSKINVVVNSFFEGSGVSKTISFRINTFDINNNVRIGTDYLFSGRHFFLRMSRINTDNYYYDIKEILEVISEENLNKAIREGNLLDEKQRQIDNLFR